MDAGGLFDARMHSGTIMPDVCLSMLPPFNRTRLFNRLNRLNRNANLLAQLIQKQIQNNPKSKIASVNRPRSSGFNGPLITLNFNDRFDIPKHYQQFLKHILALARKQKLYLAAGTSFGFDITRVYVPALHTSHVKPFFRIAVGTETIDEIHLLGRILIEALAV